MNRVAVTCIIFYALQPITQERIHRLVHLIQCICLIGNPAAQLCDRLCYLLFLVTALFKVGDQQLFLDGRVVPILQIAKEDIAEIINQPMFDLVL
ncbi:hypothetical protein SDC9_134882 [bioreactor metagenome]|uniref:Uncharacterized protein n=1 Tax=bioreactor metagenome TaxID=1076179 RepID=A0A645DGS7_9ZZZZ